MSIVLIFLIVIGILFLNLLILMTLAGIYSIIDGFIEDVTGESLSNKISNKYKEK